MAPVRMAILGYGKIAQDQHIPSINRNDAFELAAIVSNSLTDYRAVPVFKSVEALLQTECDFDALAICTPPRVRTVPALTAINAGKHVLLEKPPGLSLDDVAAMKHAAINAGVSLYASWHSRHAAAIDTAKQILRGRQIEHVTITWHEDVTKWHPGQEWIWQEGGMGVFDPGINALSILTHLIDEKFSVTNADLTIAKGRAMPIAATVKLQSENVIPVHVSLDWRPIVSEVWTIDIQTNQGVMSLIDGGNRLIVDGADYPVANARTDYDGVYQHFASLVRNGRSDIDDTPLSLTLDALNFTA